MSLSSFRQWGLSLIEIIVAVSLVALVLVLIINILPTANFSLHRATEIQSVDAYAQEVVQYAKSSLQSQALVSPLPTGSPCITTTCISLNNMNYRLTKTVYVVDWCTCSAADAYYVFQIDVDLYKTDGRCVTGSPVQVVGREMVKAPKPCATCPPCPPYGCCP